MCRQGTAWEVCRADSDAPAVLQMVRREAAAEARAREVHAAREREVRAAVAHAVGAAPTWQQLRALLSTYPGQLTAHDLGIMLTRLPGGALLPMSYTFTLP